MNRPLLVTRDDSLLDELLRLAAAAGATPEIAYDAAAGLRSWTGAPLVLLGTDLAGELGRLGPDRRGGVHVVGWGSADDEVYRHALRVGAESVVDVTASAAWLAEVLSDLGDSTRGRGVVVGVLGGSGGAGATTFACAVGQVAARSGACVVVDLDPLGPGVDRILGLEGVDGVRWDALGRAGGRLGSRELREALPRTGDLGVLTWSGRGELPEAEAVREALSALRRGHDTVVVDLPRSGDALVEEVLARCDRVLVLVTPTVVGTASAARLLARLPDPTQARLVLRGPGVSDDEVAAVTGVPVLVRMRDQRGLAEAIDLGLGPARSTRVPLGRAAAEVLRGTLRQVAA